MKFNIKYFSPAFLCARNFLYVFFLARCYKLKHMLRVVFVGWLKTKSEKQKNGEKKYGSWQLWKICAEIPPLSYGRAGRASKAP